MSSITFFELFHEKGKIPFLVGGPFKKKSRLPTPTFEHPNGRFEDLEVAKQWDTALDSC